MPSFAPSSPPEFLFGYNRANAQFIFRDFPSYNLSHEKALYVPRTYNVPAIDAILLCLNNVDKKAELIPIQITIQKAHRISEEQFFNNWFFWHDYLDDYDVNVTSLWITSDGGFQANVHGGKTP
ncbi:uncharacterized protein ACHE_11741S [Aspergillus chevalieri]|uniref:Uncharacterized protein n=1 Tax=Aspergillus chevalieri TaxID=182096 RepID=A0A7R7VIE8_ASPCH|nr:uncharacterized protein ACHE_11741S [Aspergillus chevalieri]BCR84339.1 hypothetical protein ACHE_11741S [Aspergillus chevalieri]